jgi:hypothetical protein
MYYQQNQSVADIAAALELTEANVRQRIARGRTYLKKEVERQVEKTLACIRPSEHFTVAVLAALPIALTGNQVLAAGSAGAAAAQSASSSGAGVGASFLAGLTAFFWTLLSTLYVVLFYTLPVILGIWSGIRNAPTLRARQWMIKVVLGYIVAGGLFYMLFHLAATGVNNAGGILRHFCYGASYFLLGFLPVGVLVSSFLINRRWRKIVEEDTAQQNSPVQTASPKDFSRSMYLWIGITGCFFMFALIVPAAITGYLRGTWYLPLSLMESVSFSVWLAYCFGFGLFVLLAGFLFFYYVVQISKDQESFAKYPPRLPNLLSILTGEEKAPSGFHNRINFWSDLVSVGLVLFIVSVTLFGRYTHSGDAGGNAAGLALLLILFVYFLFALFFSGIPRRRYWGMIFLYVSVFSIITIVHFMILGTFPKFNSAEEFIIGGILPVLYLLCFTLLGVSGLYAFRKKAEPKA